MPLNMRLIPRRGIQHFEQIFQRNLIVHGFLLVYKVVREALGNFMNEVVPLILDGKITILEQPYSLKDAGKALADLHTGVSVGKPVIIVAEDEL